MASYWERNYHHNFWVARGRKRALNWSNPWRVMSIQKNVFAASISVQYRKQRQSRPYCWLHQLYYSAVWIFCERRIRLSSSGWTELTLNGRTVTNRPAVRVVFSAQWNSCFCSDANMFHTVGSWIYDGLLRLGGFWEGFRTLICGSCRRHLATMNATSHRGD